MKPSIPNRPNGNAFLILILGVIFSFALWWVIPVFGKIEYHLVFTGISKGHITPYVAKFVPYQDKKMGGIPFAATVLEKIITDFQGQAFSFLSLGNEIAGTPEAYFSKGRASIDCLNLLQVEGMLVGNLELSYGQSNLTDLTRDSHFPLISSNMRVKETGKPPAGIVSEKILLPRGDLRVAVLGITPPYTAKITAQENVEGLEFLPPGKELKEKIEALRPKEADLVVLLSEYTSHTLTPSDWDAIKDCRPDLFIMLDFDPDAPPPVLRDGILVKSISGYNQGKEIDVLDLVISGVPKRITGFNTHRYPIFSDEVTPNEKVADEISNILGQISAIKAQRVGEFAADAERRYEEECPIGNLVTDALRDYSKADIAFMNSGGIKSNIKKGEFTLDNLYNVLPFDNETVTMDLTGGEIEDILAVAASLHKGVLQTSGCSYVFSNKNSEDYDVKTVLVNGQPIVGSQTYRVVANEFIADGGDGYKPFKNATNKVVGPLQREILRGYIERLCASGPIQLKTENRIQRN